MFDSQWHFCKHVLLIFLSRLVKRGLVQKTNFHNKVVAYILLVYHDIMFPAIGTCTWTNKLEKNPHKNEILEMTTCQRDTHIVHKRHFSAVCKSSNYKSMLSSKASVYYAVCLAQDTPSNIKLYYHYVNEVLTY